MVKQTINCFYTRIIRVAPIVEGYPEEKKGGILLFFYFHPK